MDEKTNTDFLILSKWRQTEKVLKKWIGEHVVGRMNGWLEFGGGSDGQ